jgi:ATP-dependent HslUV protease ATP-binding subunit HslU
VELQPLTEADLVRILTEPRSALLEQYRALLATEGVDLSFTEEAVHELARFAAEVNTATENIGARRLATILEAVLEEVSFEAPSGARRVEIDADEVRRKLAPLAKSQDLSRFIL